MKRVNTLKQLRQSINGRRRAVEAQLVAMTAGPSLVKTRTMLVNFSKNVAIPPGSAGRVVDRRDNGELLIQFPGLSSLYSLPADSRLIEVIE